MGPNVLIDRLVYRLRHLLAFRICDYLDLKPEKVLVHWACSRVMSTDDDKTVLASIKEKLKICPNVSWAIVAATAFAAQKTELAISVCILQLKLMISYLTMKKMLVSKFHCFLRWDKRKRH